MIVTLSARAMDDLVTLATYEPNFAAKALLLIGECRRTPFIGRGKPEPLHDRAGWWSRRITEEHRLVYRVVDGQLEIGQCRGHY